MVPSVLSAYAATWMTPSGASSTVAPVIGCPSATGVLVTPSPSGHAIINCDVVSSDIDSQSHIGGPPPIIMHAATSVPTWWSSVNSIRTSPLSLATTPIARTTV